MAELNVELLPWQQEVFADKSRFKVIAAGRRCGKSRLAAWTLILEALKTSKANSHVFYVAPTQGQARDIMWGTLIELAHSVITSTHVNNMQIKLVNGATISLKGADRPDTMRGVSLRYLVLDEFAEMKPEVFEEVLRPALADQQGHAMFIGTPKGRNNFYELYKYAELEDDDDWKAWHFTSYDNPLIPKDEVDRAKKSMSSFAFRQEFMASFEAKGSEMFHESWVQFTDDSNHIVGDYYVAVDLAGFEELGKKRSSKRLDNTAIAIVKVGTEGWVVENIIRGRWTLEQTAAKIFQAVRDYQPISVGIERGLAKQAVMSPLFDLMKQYNRFFRVEELTHGNKNKIDRIMWALQGRFENGRIWIKKGEWNYPFLDELYQFPDPLTHDDTVDALAYIDQLAQIAYGTDLLDLDEFEELDSVSGY